MKTDDHHAGRRAREVYRYFRQLTPIDETQSFKSDGSLKSTNNSDLSTLLPSSSGTTSPNAWTPSPIKPMPDSLALGTSNATLTSFAQLTALRLNMDRVFISVSDRDSQFVIAQAAQTKQGNNKYDSLENGVYDGCSTLNVNSWTPCQDTIALPQSKREQGEYEFIVSNDLIQDARYKDLPFVKGDPNFRFYAGTPLTTESQINVGCFFVLDTKPHAEFSEIDKETMGTMGMLIMDYLMVSRQASEGRRAARLSHGLNLFIDRKSSFTDSVEDSTMYSGSHQYKNTPPSSKTRESRHPSSTHRRAAWRSRSRSSESGSSIASETTGNHSLSSSVDSSMHSRFPGLGSKRRPEYEEKGNFWTFQRAANLIRESLELEGDSGVAFIEAGNDLELDNETGSDTASSTKAKKVASALSISTGDHSFGLETGMLSQYPVSGIDEGFMQGLLNRYSQGKIWSFHRDGLFSSSDSESAPRESRALTRTRSSRSTRPNKWRSLENKMLNRLFPGATQVIFVPLWNAANSRWFGGCFCWNNVESLVFDPAVELSSVLGFGSSIMAECNRVEAHISNRQKEDFLGSVSHELRSPLHGVLAAAELLQGTEFDGFQNSLLETINSCGRTLLDTMNQVLDYTKLVSLEKDLRHLKRNMSSTIDVKSMQHSGHLDAYTSTDISLMSEEVMDGVCLGHSYSQRPAASLDAAGAHLIDSKAPDLDIPELHVDVTLDIAQNDWVYFTPPGALRRIIMNILSNAIKYTDSGRVSVFLDAKEAPDSRFPHHGTKEDLITLTVSDTGRGMSADFLRSKLFVPFAQENNLSVGTGLGLSIVRSLVKSLRGTIKVDSRPGEGTTVKVTLPLVRHEQEEYGSIQGALPSPPQEGFDPTTSEVHLLRDTHLGRKVAILGVEPSDARKHPLWGTISRYLVDWYGLELTSPSSGIPVDVVLADGPPPKEGTDWRFTDPNQAVLVLSSKYVGHDTVRAEWSPFTKMVNVLSRPCGPHKLVRFLQKCFGQASSMSLPEPVVPLESQPKMPPMPPMPIDDASAPSVDTKPSSTEDISSFHDASLPSPTNKPADPSPPASSIKPTEAPQEPCKPRVLVVEDNKINLNLMLAFLKKQKLVTLDSAENGKLAVDAVEKLQGSYDIIFMDISMPVMDGFDATRSIRALEKQRGPDSPASTIIALTGLSGSSDELAALGAGMDLFLTKPVTLKNVSKILDRWSQEGLQHP